MTLPIMPYVNRAERRETLLAAINHKGLASNLKLCLDIGDAVSYPFASGQTWFDRSGNVVDFFRGTASSVQTNDPTPNGSAGDLSSATYWSFDGGDCFQANTGASGYAAALAGWISNIHKVGAKCTFFCWFYPSAAGTFALLGTSGIQGSGDRGFQWYCGGGTNLSFALKHGMAGINDGVNFPLNQWNCAAFSLDEAAGTAFFFLNGNVQTRACSYSGADTGTATNTIMVSGSGNTGDLRGLPSGSRLSQLAIWEGVSLTAAQVAKLWKATQPRF